MGQNTIETTSFLTDFLDKNAGTVAWGLYLVVAILFIQGIRMMNSPKTARRGNFLSIAGMVLAVVVAFAQALIGGFENNIALFALVAGIILGTVGGVVSARNVKMTAMPQLVSLFNTVGGGAAALVAVNDVLSNHIISKLPRFIHGSVEVTKGQIIGFTPDDVTLIGQVDHFALFAASLGIFIGCVTFTGSLIAAGKLQGVLNGNATQIPGVVVIDALCVIGSIVCGYAITTGNTFGQPVWVLAVLLIVFALLLGVTFVLPIGGADMPVVISVLNDCTGTAVAMAGFVINNLIMIVAGALVGSAGALLSQLMAKAMNRSLGSVLVGGFGATAVTAVDGDVQVTQETSAEDLAVQMSYADKVIIVPGYGMAVAGAQHEIAELTNILEEKGVNVLFAIHPVAGRMPGHMNVLLAEANIGYDKLLDLDDVNSQFATTDVALVIGANDVTNPAARREGTPISGMPILDVDVAKAVVVIKRGRGKGYAGIENELYGLPQTSMLYGDAKKAVGDIIAAVKEI